MGRWLLKAERLLDANGEVISRLSWPWANAKTSGFANWSTFFGVLTSYCVCFYSPALCLCCVSGSGQVQCVHSHALLRQWDSRQFPREIWPSKQSGALQYCSRSKKSGRTISTDPMSGERTLRKSTMHRIRRKGLPQASPFLWVCFPADPCHAGAAPGPAAGPAARRAAGLAPDLRPALVLVPLPREPAFRRRTHNAQGVCGVSEELAEHSCQV